MAEIIQEELRATTQRRMTPGERRFAQRLKSFLDSDYLCWYDIPIGKQQRYPDFIVLHPARGLLFLEVKDWKPSTLKKISKERVSLLTNDGLKAQANPFVQVRQYAMEAIKLLQRDPLLQACDNRHHGQLIFPYGWGVVFTNITRKQIEDAIEESDRESLLPDHLMIYKDEMTESVDPEDFQQRLWNMYKYRFGKQLSLPQINRIRWHLFPELRIDLPTQGDIFTEEPEALPEIPDIIRVMDIQQEQLARSLGEGHRVVHGVAGSGKTLILGCRAEALAPIAKAKNKPILILCFNTSLAAKLRNTMAQKSLSEWVHVYHFHEWCGTQLRTYHVDVIRGEAPHWERQVESVIEGVDKDRIPRAQYSALLIDEGHDFEPDWLKLVVQMIDPDTNSLLFLYDDAQSIYANKSKLKFSLASVGIQASGRTSILRLNYRNTREILDFAYQFAKEFFREHDGSDELRLVEPEAAGNNGPKPKVHHLAQWQQEVDICIGNIFAWHQQGLDWRHMAVIYTAGYIGKAVAQQLRKLKVPHLWMASKIYKKAYDPAIDRVTVLSIHSSKGLEFPAVIMTGVGQLKSDDIAHDGRLLYVGMTRAQHELHVCCSVENSLTKKLSQ